jgi:pyruvate/2-oxoglutarate dehydrogenase complex dihydrolipoamide dehydrogenase (E3) component
MVGGSIIGCEFASLWEAFEIDVTIVARGLMPQEEPEVGTALLEAFEASDIRLIRSGVVELARAAGRRAVGVARGWSRDQSESRGGAHGDRPPGPVPRPASRRGRCVDLGAGIAVGATMRTSASHIWAASGVSSGDGRAGQRLACQ